MPRSNPAGKEKGSERSKWMDRPAGSGLTVTAESDTVELTAITPVTGRLSLLFGSEVEDGMKHRMLYLAAAALLIVLGLGVRRHSSELPPLIAEHAGDALWAAMVYCCFRALLIGRSRLAAFWAALIFSFAIELSQLYQAEWINGIRATALGALILGNGFLAADLVRYLVGSAAAFVIDGLCAESGWSRTNRRL